MFTLQYYKYYILIKHTSKVIQQTFRITTNEYIFSKEKMQTVYTRYLCLLFSS